MSVGPRDYTLFRINAAGEVVNTLETSFDGFSYREGRILATEPTAMSIWVTPEGGLRRWSYTYPESGNFRVRAVFLNSDGERRSAYLTDDELTEFPEATPAP